MSHLTTAALTVLAEGPIPAFTPAVPAPLKGVTGTILSWAAGGGLSLAVLGGLVSWALIGVGHSTQNAQWAARGKAGVLASLAGAGGIGVTASLVLAMFNVAAAK
ncbi:hypothetical protein ACWCQL_13270 [Streptomyces sp. NPDC002073]